MAVLVACGGPQKPPENPASQSAGTPAANDGSTYKKQQGASFDTAPPAAPAKVEAAPSKAPKDQPAAAPTPAPAPAPAPVAADPANETSQAEAALRGGRYEDAIRLSRLALSRNERYVPAMVVMAKAYYYLGRRDQAVYVLRTRVLEPMGKGELMVENRDQAEIANLLGMVALKKSDKPEALKKFREATEKNPNHVAAWINLCALLVQQKDYQAAVPAGERAAALAPNLAKAHLNLGSAYRGSKMYEKANQELRRALELQADYPEAFFDLGLLYMDATDYPGMQAIERLETAIKMLTEYKNRARASGKLLRDDPVDELLKRANSDLKDERKSLERKRKKAERDAQKAREKAAEAQGAAKPPAPAPEKGNK
jgi:tetratricopeptide (TPR) repeat protein